MEKHSQQYMTNCLMFETYDYDNILWEFDESDNLHDVMIKDYVHRHFQIKSNLTESIKSIFPNVTISHDKDEIKIGDSYRIFLNEIRRGSWIVDNYDQMLPYKIDRTKNKDKKYLDSYGFTFLDLIAKYFGINENFITKEAIRKFNIDVSYKNRYLFDYKPNHDIVLSSSKKPDTDILKIIYTNFPTHIMCKKIYSYKNMNEEKYAYHVAYLQDKNNIEYKIPITLWKEHKKNNPNERFDILNSNSTLQLYNYPNFSNDLKRVLICEDEYQIDEINNSTNIKDFYKLTTWSGGMKCTIDKTDWHIYNNNDNLVIIMTSQNKDSYINSNKVHNHILKNGHSRTGFSFNNKTKENTDAKLITQNFIECEKQNSFMDYAEFCEDAYKKFGLKFQKEDRIEVYTGKQLLELPPEPIEPVLAPLINKGNRVMICGSRGTGKSWLAMTIAATIASGGQLFKNSDVYKSDKTNKVLYLDGEMSILEEKDRIEKIFSTFESKNEGLDNIKIINALQNSEKFLFKNLKDINIIKNEIEWADVIIIDSVFFFFPDAMGSQFEGAHTLNQFLVKNSTKNITTIIIDHTGKTKSDHAYGTIGKEITLDLIIKITNSKNNEINFEITKSRNYKIDDSNKKIKYNLITDDRSAKLDICNNKKTNDKKMNSNSKEKETADTIFDNIIKYYTKNPGKPIRPAAKDLDIPHQTLGKYLQNLSSEGQIHKIGGHYYVKK